MGAWADAKTGEYVMGNTRCHIGTFSDGAGAGGGDINTGLSVVEFMLLQPTGAAVAADQCAINETLPFAGSAITIVCTASTAGIWIAWGR